METNGIKFTRHIYNRLKGTESKKEYELIKNTLAKPILPEIVRIELNQDLQNSKKINSWLLVNNIPNWKYGSKVTALIPTGKNNIFEGNLRNLNFEKSMPGSLIFFEFSRNNEMLVIDIFEDFYTENPFAFNLILEAHKFLLRKKAS